MDIFGYLMGIKEKYLGKLWNTVEYCGKPWKFAD